MRRSKSRKKRQRKTKKENEREVSEARIAWVMKEERTKGIRKVVLRGLMILALFRVLLKYL